MDDTEKVFALLEHTGAHDPSPVWSLSTTREKAQADLEELEKELSEWASYKIEKPHLEIVEVPLNQLLKAWFN